MHFSSFEAEISQEGPQAARALIARLAPELEEASTTYRAAMVMLMAQVVGQGVHKLAAVTGYPSEFVARCARRLVDNGVWPAGEAGGAADVEAFWLDVGVAEGKLCRRLDETGNPQWAPAGHWWKEFDYSLGRTVSEGVVRYKPATVAPMTLLRDEMCESESEDVEVEEVPVGMAAAPLAPRPFPRPGAAARRAAGVAIGEVVVLGAELSSARWLS